jgi:bacteriocin biosynthesis cyclodehydratase domain-containing protein
VSWLQLRPTHQLVAIGRRAVVRRRGSARLIAIDDPGVDVVALAPLVAGGVRRDELARRFAEGPLERLLTTLRASGALLEAEAPPWAEDSWVGAELAQLAGGEGGLAFEAVARVRAARVLMIGDGELAASCARHLQTRGVGQVSLAGRGAALPIDVTSSEDVAELAGELGASLVIVAGDAEAARLATRACAASGVALLVGAATSFGPLFVPGASACPACGRAGARDLDQRRSHYRDRLDDAPAAPAPSTHIAVAAALLAHEAILWLAGGADRCRSIDHRIEIGPHLELGRHAIARDPACSACGPLAKGPVPEVTVIRPAEVAPFVKAHAVHVDHRLPVQDGEPHLAGHGFHLDEERARRQAAAELVEHLSAFYRGLDARRFATGTHEELSARRAVLPLAALARYRDHQALPASLARIARDTRITWTEAEIEGSGAIVLVPALLAYLLWSPPPGEPRFAQPDATGLAAQRTREAAVLHGWQEVVERDAAMLSWRIPDWTVAALSRDLLSREFRRATGRLAIELYDIGRLAAPSVVLAIVSERDGRMATCGTACRADPAGAAEHAVEEALMLRHAVMTARPRVVDVPTSSLEHVARTFADGREVIEWYRALPRHAGGFRPPGRAAMLSGGPLAGPLVVDATDARTRAAGWTVVRVIVAGAQPREPDARAPCLGSAQLAGCERLHLAPHPFG